ncbi:MAG TPA: hypothetical protein VNF92_05320 [Gemmatimonadaceae bacterium]|nr:hypothetical protein [Gemmatimonadaceae bacterium]
MTTAEVARRRQHVVKDGRLWHDPSPRPIPVARYAEYQILVPLMPQSPRRLKRAA